MLATAADYCALIL